MFRVGSTSLGPHLTTLARDLRNVGGVTEGVGRIRYASDILLAKAMNTVPVPRIDAVRTIRLRGGGELVYRLNRGDLQSIRECLVQDDYKLPDDVGAVDAFIDVGANIGLTTIAFARRLRLGHVVCVEPSPENARLLRENLRRNGIAAIVIEAAVGDRDGTASFVRARSANMGRIGEGGEDVRVVSMGTVLAAVPAAVRIGLLKIDIEGAEADILRGSLSWLSRVDHVVMEIHSVLDVDPGWCEERFALAGLTLVDTQRDVWTFSRCS